MFNSEVASLAAIEKTNTIKVPHPFGVVKGSKNVYYCILEFVEINSLSKFTSKLGEKLAELHLHNELVAKNGEDGEYVSRFGFPVTTCVGLLPVNNTWFDDWPVRSPCPSSEFFIVIPANYVTFSDILQQQA